VISKHSILSTRWDLAALLLFLAYFFVIVATFTYYGITWDEYWHANYGDLLLRWYASFGHDRAALTYWIMNLYGGFFDILAQLFTRISPFGLFETRHLMTAMFGLLGVVVVCRIGRDLEGPLAGFLAALFLLLTPRYYGHTFNNQVDIPFAATFTLGLYYLIQIELHLPKIPRHLLIKFGLFTGLATAIRIGGVLLIGYLGAALCLWWVTQRYLRAAPAEESSVSMQSILALGKSLLGVCAIAYVVMLAWWPPAQAQPIIQPIKALVRMSKFSTFTQKVFFAGRMWEAKDLPTDYLARWIALTLPEFYFLTLTIGLGLMAVAFSRGKHLFGEPKFVSYVVLVFSVLFPPVYATFTRAIVYDEWRQFLFILPPLAILGGISLARFLKSSLSQVVKAVVLAAVVLSLASSAYDMMQLHPYQYIYFNRLVAGGLGQASRSYETDYWGLSYKEGVQWIKQNYPVRPDGRKTRVASCSNPTSTAYFLPADRFEYVGSFDAMVRMTGHPDIFLSTVRWGCDKTFQGRVVHVVSRMNTPLLYVKEVGADEVPARPY
jgi:4-amino-4-deoxy-L-arabinose transferase-like glycosyltransferase